MTAEYQHIEYKQSLSEKHEATVALAAFATSQGGEVHFGVAPDGRRIGVQLGKSSLEELANYIKQNTDPPIFPSIQVEGDERSAVVIVRAEESPIKPVWAFGRPYKRVGRTNQGLSREETQRLVDHTRGFTWDALPCSRLKLEHMDRATVQAYLRRAEQDTTTPTEAVLDTLELRDGNTLFNGAALLFTATPERWLDCTKVQCARFLGTSQIDFLNEQAFYGNVISQIDSAVDFVARNTRNSIVITGKPQHDRVPEYPVAAVREAIINAVCHRDYTAAGNVQIRIDDNGLEVWNPGGLPYDLSLESLSRQHHSHPRNKRLAEAFYRAGLIEAWGTGTLRIIKAYTEQGLAAPTFRYEMGTFIVQMLPTPPPFDLPTQRQEANLSGLSEPKRKAVEYVQQHGSITAEEYGQLAELGRRQSQKHLGELIELGFLAKKGQGKNTRYVSTNRVRVRE